MKLNASERVIWAVAFVLELRERDQDQARSFDFDRLTGLDDKTRMALFYAHMNRGALSAANLATEAVKKLREVVLPHVKENPEMLETISSILGIETGAPYR